MDVGYVFNFLIRKLPFVLIYSCKTFLRRFFTFLWL